MTNLRSALLAAFIALAASRAGVEGVALTSSSSRVAGKLRATAIAALLEGRSRAQANANANSNASSALLGGSLSGKKPIISEHGKAPIGDMCMVDSACDSGKCRLGFCSENCKSELDQCHCDKDDERCDECCGDLPYCWRSGFNAYKTCNRKQAPKYPFVLFETMWVRKSDGKKFETSHKKLDAPPYWKSRGEGRYETRRVRSAKPYDVASCAKIENIYNDPFTHYGQPISAGPATGCFDSQKIDFGDGLPAGNGGCPTAADDYPNGPGAQSITFHDDDNLYTKPKAYSSVTDYKQGGCCEVRRSGRDKLKEEFAKWGWERAPCCEPEDQRGALLTGKPHASLWDRACEHQGESSEDTCWRLAFDWAQARAGFWKDQEEERKVALEPYKNAGCCKLPAPKVPASMSLAMNNPRGDDGDWRSPPSLSGASTTLHGLACP